MQVISDKPFTDDYNGLTIGLQLLSGHKIIGTLLGSWINTLKVQDWNDRLHKEVHCQTITRCMISVPTGKGEGSDRKEKD